LGVEKAESTRGGNVTITVNGQQVAVPEGTTVSALLEVLDVEPAQIAVELDGRVAAREAWSDTTISAEATLEIVRFVGGG
jgi:thiamine biosynthesis protein ThiS